LIRFEFAIDAFQDLSLDKGASKEISLSWRLNFAVKHKVLPLFGSLFTQILPPIIDN
jgi:hypothetical protein